MNDGTPTNDVHWLETKTSDEKRGNPKMQVAQNKDIR
jgi:hypothetical protein